MILTYEELHEQLYYNSCTGIFYWKLSKQGHIKNGDIAGGKHSEGYITIGINGKQYLAHILAWFYTHGYWPENDIDHEDRVRHHNWIENLREISRQCNSRNTGNPKNNISGVKGVSWDKGGKKWRASICIDKKSKNLGVYSHFHNTVCARLAGEQCVNWEGCDSSSPAYLYVLNNIQRNINLCL